MKMVLKVRVVTSGERVTFGKGHEMAPASLPESCVLQIHAFSLSVIEGR